MIGQLVNLLSWIAFTAFLLLLVGGWIGWWPS